MRYLSLFLLLLSSLHSFAQEAFYIKDHQVQIKVEESSALKVRERLLVHFTEPRRGIIRHIPISYQLRNDGGEQMQQTGFQEGDTYHIVIEDVRVKDWPLQQSVSAGNLMIRIGNPDKTIEGDQVYEISYTVYGAIKQFSQHNELIWNVIGHESAVITQNANWSIQLPKPLSPEQDDYFVFSGRKGEKGKNASLSFSPNKLSGKTSIPLNPYEGVTVGMKFPQGYFDWTQIPLETYAKTFWIPNYTIDVFLQADGSMDIQQHSEIIPKKGEYYYGGFEYIIPQTLPLSSYSSGHKLSQGADMSWLAKSSKLLISNLKFDADSNDLSNYRESYSLKPRSYLIGDSIFPIDASYSIYGIIHPLKPEKTSLFELWHGVEEPVQATFRIHPPKGVQLDSSHLQIAHIHRNLSEDSLLNPLPMSFQDGVWVAKYEDRTGLQSIYLQTNLPKDFISQPNYTALFQLVWTNNWPLMIPILMLLFLWLLWALVGRDRVFSKVVRFLPPEDMSPAEAGFLIDDRLDNRDMIAMLYHWAANGYIQIREICSQYHEDLRPIDYEFIYLKDLPSNSPKFEKILFEGIFLDNQKDEVDLQKKLSNLRYRFHTKLKDAKKELRSYMKRKQYYVPGTMEFAVVLRIIGASAWVPVLPLTIAALFSKSYEFGGAWDMPLGLFLTGGIILFFSSIMPKRQMAGQKLYEKLVGFREFIERAEQDRLEHLLDEDPNYFGQTLAYAMAFGLTPIWTEKFDPLLRAYPQWYISDRKEQFDTHLFFNNLNRSISHINSDFTAIPSPPPSSSSRSFSSSGSSSFSSVSSSSSFSSSSFSSSGYSGGGFGGGGVSSW